MSTGLLTDVHDGLQIDNFSRNCYLVKGSYEYYHYLCDGFNDRVGFNIFYYYNDFWIILDVFKFCKFIMISFLHFQHWGCGYRTLQTICSWLNLNYEKSEKVPSIREIQKVLVDLEDKPSSFLGSRQWIGSFEVWIYYMKNIIQYKLFKNTDIEYFKMYLTYIFQVCLVIDNLYDVPSKIVHINKGDLLEDVVEQLKNHFEKFGSPIMMGGDIDCSSKGIMGIHVNGAHSSLLVVVSNYFILM